MSVRKENQGGLKLCLTCSLYLLVAALPLPLLFLGNVATVLLVLGEAVEGGVLEVFGGGGGSGGSGDSVIDAPPTGSVLSVKAGLAVFRASRLTS